MIYCVNKFDDTAKHCSLSVSVQEKQTAARKVTVQFRQYV